MKPEGGDRLRDGDPEFARLVSALRNAGPSRDSLARTLAAVEGAATEPSLPPASGSRPARTATIALGAGAVALVLAAAAGYEWRGSSASAPEAPPAAVTSLASARDEVAPSDVPTSSVRVEDLPPAPAAAPGSPVATQARPLAGPKMAPSVALAPPPSTNAPAPSADDFRDELALVERVRTQLSSGDHEACLRSIDQYGARFHGGAFVQEVEVMRIEALAASGDRGRARTFGGKFLSEHPTSPYAGRVRSVLENSK